jgi:hypothetical protein
VSDDEAMEGMTWRDLVHEVATELGKPLPSDDETDNILWEHTAFPMASPIHIRKQLEEFFTDG